MQIRFLMWSNICIKHDDKSHKDDRIKHAMLRMIQNENSLVITEYTDCQGVSGTSSFTFAKPKVVELTPTGIVVRATWFSYSFQTKESHEHDVTVTADF